MLGLHRDSLANLTALHHHSFDDDDKQAVDREIDGSEFNESDEDFIGICIDDDDDDNINENDKEKMYSELNNLAIISTARENQENTRTLSSKDSSSSGFSDGSEDDEYYDYYDNYTSGTGMWLDNKDNKSKNNLFECFFPCFPFMSNKHKQKTLQQQHQNESKDNSEHNGSQQSDNYVDVYEHLNSIPSNTSDDESRNTYLYGRPLTQLQHQAVLARLNLPEVRSASMPPHHGLHNAVKLQKPDEGAGPINGEKPKKLKGILKHPTPPPEPGHGRSISMSVLSQEKPARRNLFPTSSKTYKSSEKKNIKFISLAKVSTVPSLSSMSFVTRSNVWWQKGEYDDFKKAARIITKALLTGGSEIWLSESKDRDKNGVEEDKDTYGSKWWCKFGHSRRGLEHLCNISEGRNRQKNVIQATKAVVDEYRRQKVVGHFDDKRLALVSSQYTTWARDLAHAAALADQEGVKKNFHHTAKNRNDFVLQTLKQHQHNYDMPDTTITVGDVIGVELPKVSNPNKTQINSSNATHDPHMLDAHTHSSMVYRKHQLKSLRNSLIEQQRQHSSDSSLKKKAAGYGINGQKDIALSVLPRSKIGVV